MWENPKVLQGAIDTQGWIQTCATSFQKLVRIVKKKQKAMPESPNR